MNPLTRVRLCLVAAIIALATPVSGLAAETASAGDFINVKGVGSTSLPIPVYGVVPGPWSDAWFQRDFPDVGFLREARVALIPLAEGEPGSANVGASGARHGKAPAAAGIRGPKITITRRPGF